MNADAPLRHSSKSAYAPPIKASTASAPARRQRLHGLPYADQINRQIKKVLRILHLKIERL
jgi:hypothetical protein